MGIIYTIVQILGACCGYGMLLALSPYHAFGSPFCMTLPHKDITDVQALFIEFFMAFILVGAILGIWDPRNKHLQDSSAIKVGLIVAGLCFAGGSFTGTSLNPARSFAPSLWNWHWKSHWVYWAGPLLGSFVVSILYKYVFQKNLNRDESEEKKENSIEKF